MSSSGNGSDPMKANSARVYELLLAGETPGVPFTDADHAMAEQIAQNAPNNVQGIHLNRLYIQVAAKAYQTAGIRQYIDIGAGLPTGGSLHLFVQPEAAVLYADSDPETVAYGQIALAEQSYLRYTQARLEEIEPILAEADRLFGGNRLVGVNLISMVHFVDDEQLARSLQQLYDWAAPGSMLAVTSTQGESTVDHKKARTEYTKRTGLSIYLRTPEELTKLCTPWQPYIDLQPFEDQIEATLGTRVVLTQYRGLLGYGGIFIKP